MTAQFNADESRFHGKYESSLLDTLYQAYRPWLARTVLSLVVGFLGRIVLFGNANLIGFWADSLDPNRRRAIPAFLQDCSSHDFVVLLGVATLTGFLLTLGFRTWISRASVEAVSHIYDETTLRTSRLPMSFFDRNPAGRVMTRFTSDYNNVFRIFGGPLAEFIGLVFEICAMTLLIGFASPWFIPFWLMQVGANYGVYRLNLRRLRLERRAVAAKRSPGIAHFAEAAGGSAVIRAYSKQRVFSGRFASLNDAYLVQRLSTAGVSARFSLSMGFVTASSFLVTGLASYSLLKLGKVSVGSIGVAFAYLGLSSNILQSFFEWLGQFEEAMTGLERMNEYLRLELEPGASLPKQARFKTGHRVQGVPVGWAEGAKKIQSSLSSNGSLNGGARVEIRDLWMRYRSDLQPVLRGIDLKVEAGERLAIVGRTGSGKTSLVQALFRLYPIERGQVLIGGKSALVEPDELAKSNGGLGFSSQMELGEYRRQLAYITQDPTLFVGALRENLIALSEEKKGADWVELDLKLAGVLQKVQLLGAGAKISDYLEILDSPVQERGRNFSAGERQLICMARCLLQDVPVVILDEATSAVDPVSEEIITRGAREFFAGRTQIIVAHRLSTIEHCDRVLWLEGGIIRQLDRPDQILPGLSSDLAKY